MPLLFLYAVFLMSHVMSLVIYLGLPYFLGVFGAVLFVIPIGASAPLILKQREFVSWWGPLHQSMSMCFKSAMPQLTCKREASTARLVLTNSRGGLTGTVRLVLPNTMHPVLTDTMPSFVACGPLFSLARCVLQQVGFLQYSAVYV